MELQKVILKRNLFHLGINQTVHRIYLDVECNVSVDSIINYKISSIETDILIAETVIVGGVPETYYNIGEISSSDTLDVIND